MVLVLVLVQKFLTGFRMSMISGVRESGGRGLGRVLLL